MRPSSRHHHLKTRDVGLLLEAVVEVFLDGCPDSASLLLLEFVSSLEEEALLWRAVVFDDKLLGAGLGGARRRGLNKRRCGGFAVFGRAVSHARGSLHPGLTSAVGGRAVDLRAGECERIALSPGQVVSVGQRQVVATGVRMGVEGHVSGRGEGPSHGLVSHGQIRRAHQGGRVEHGTVRGHVEARMHGRRQGTVGFVLSRNTVGAEVRNRRLGNFVLDGRF